ncbi:MAG: hypothetical protein EOP23_09285 [Hyphomicrobiales bacterium]|nr:MAG: hypothetical protein EOP23_09285 [Hyphomicrobiales bacterium]
MRPERVRQIPALVKAPSFGGRLQAANDNKPDIRESFVSILIGRSLIVGAALLAVAIVAGWSLWLGRTVWRHFA